MSPQSSYAFTKLVVDDLEKMAAFYSQVYGLREIARVQERIAGAAIDEIMLGRRRGDESRLARAAEVRRRTAAARSARSFSASPPTICPRSWSGFSPRAGVCTRRSATCPR